MGRDIAALLMFLAERADMPFAWGPQRNDCVSFAAGAVQVQTGMPLLPSRNWSTARGAARVLREFGGLENALNNRLTPISPAFAERGDLAGISDPLFGVRLMVVEGATLAGPGAIRIVRCQRSAMVRAWSIKELCT